MSRRTSRNTTVRSFRPIEAIKFRMGQLELKPSDLADILGARNRVSKIFNKKRKLTVEMTEAKSGVIGGTEDEED